MGRHTLGRWDMAPEDRYELSVVRSGEDECWEWIGPKTRDGYGKLSCGSRYTDDGRARTVLAHRWGYERLVGPIPAGQVVRHSCDNAACQNPGHWLLGTQADNIGDMDERGRRNSFRVGSTRLTEDEVREIRRLGGTLKARGELSQSELARRFSVSQATISAIVLGKSRLDVAPIKESQYEPAR